MTNHNLFANLFPIYKYRVFIINALEQYSPPLMTLTYMKHTDFLTHGGETKGKMILVIGVYNWKSAEPLHSQITNNAYCIYSDITKIILN